ncbi:hypothetical protein Ancab_030490 [Ancistrocladus abbreviatus]
MENSSSTSTPSQSSTVNKAFSGIASVVKLLPTGTVFVFMFLSPVVSNNGKCHHANKIMTAVLVGVSGLCCALASFTDSYIDKSGKTHYGIVTTKGLLTFDGCEDKMEMEESKYKLRLADFVHAGLCLVVFGVLAILNSDTVDCFFPSIRSSENTLIAVLPAVVGVVSGSVFSLFPSTRHGLGYPSSSTTSSSGVTATA